MSDISKTLVELVDERPNIDNSHAFSLLWETYAQLRRKFDARFTVTLDPACKDFVPEYRALPGFDARGMLSTWSGPEIDWFVHSWIGNPKMSFTNMHFTVWLGPHVKAPHLAMAMGTVPDVFVYFDYMARSDAVIDLEHYDRYYLGAFDAEFQAARKNPEFKWFNSPSGYVRRVISESAICMTCKPSDENLAEIRRMAHAHIDRWLRWVDEAPRVPEAERAGLAARDLALRKNSAERDPANVIAVKLFGADMEKRLVRGLWGGDRTLPRPVGPA